ncbi:MAG TPA: NB-ARC domain-containing protein [Ktedonobacteraceae bacterium]|nr:NB-ARC domain-containing protein [Ktedonobacteraceae bacterium]
MNTMAFGERVQEYLRASGYSQKELAEEIGLHPKVLSRKLHNSGKAHLTHLNVHRIVIILARWQAISSKDEAIQLLELAHMRPNYFSSEDWQRPPLNQLLARSTQNFVSTNSRTSIYFPKHNLPVPNTRLIGREWAVERLTRLLEKEEVRLLTLVGAGGSGKSRLALHLARLKVEDFSHGVWYVSLTRVDDPALVPMSIIQTLGVRHSPDISIMQNLISYLRNKKLMLVLDNFEHVGEARIVVDEMLAAAPGLKVLVTSRVVLRLYGEYEFHVPPLDVPDVGIEIKTEKLSQYGAIQLFVERAHAIISDFTLTTANAYSIAQICARVDGLPLALELAAARVKLLPPDVLLQMLSETLLGVLTGGAMNLPSRQQTLRNTLDWSYNLLSSIEQDWFLRLGVFVGGWSLEAADAMIQSVDADQKTLSYPALVMLEQLADNSLLVRLPIMGDQVYFTVLYTLREYMLEKLSTQGLYEQLKDWHASYYLQVVEEAEIGLRGPQQLLWLERLKANQDNIRAALEWSLQRAKAGASINSPSSEQGAISAIELCLRLAAGLRPYWEWQGYLTEGRTWLREVLEVLPQNEERKSVLVARAKALSVKSRLACLQNEQIRAAELADESIALWKQLDNPGGLAMAMLHRGWAAHAMGEYQEAKRVYLEGIQHASQISDRWLQAQLLFHLAAAEGFISDFKQMRTYYAQSKELFEQVGDTIAVADLLKDQGGITILEGNYAEAIDYLVRSIKMCFKLGHKQFVATGMGSLSFAVGLRGEPEPRQASILSAQLGGAAESLMDEIGLTPWTKSSRLVQMARQFIRSRVDEESWIIAWAEGRDFTIEQAVDLACRLA